MEIHIKTKWAQRLKEIQNVDDHYFISVDVSNITLFNHDTRRFQITLLFVVRNKNIFMFKSMEIDSVDVLRGNTYFLTNSSILVKNNDFVPEHVIIEDDPYYISLDWLTGEMTRRKHLGRQELIEMYADLIDQNINIHRELVEDVLEAMCDVDKKEVCEKMKTKHFDLVK